MLPLAFIESMGWQHIFLIIEYVALFMAVWVHWATSLLFDVAVISSMLHQSWNTKQWPVSPSSQIPSDDAPPPPHIQSDDDPPEHNEFDDDSGPSESDSDSVCSHSNYTFRGTNQYQNRMRCRNCGEVWTA